MCGNSARTDPRGGRSAMVVPTATVNEMAAVMATEKFFAHYLGGRYQEGGTPAVTARLKEITVDPKTVVLAKKVGNP